MSHEADAETARKALAEKLGEDEAARLTENAYQKAMLLARAGIIAGSGITMTYGPTAAAFLADCDEFLRGIVLGKIGSDNCAEMVENLLPQAIVERFQERMDESLAQLAERRCPDKKDLS